MKRWMTSVACVGFVAVSPAQDGTVTLTDGQRIDIVRLRGPGVPELAPQINGVVGDVTVTYLINRDLLRVDFQHDREGHVTAATVVGRNGKAASLTQARYAWDELEYELLDPVLDRPVVNKTPIGKVRSISLDGGALMQNARTGRIWPADYRYDPFDGSPLVATQKRGNAPVADARCCPSCLKTTNEVSCGKCKLPTVPLRSDVAMKPLDYFIERAGLDASSERATHAKRYARAWLNPWASEDDIIRELRAFVDAR